MKYHQPDRRISFFLMQTLVGHMPVLLVQANINVSTRQVIHPLTFDYYSY